jgi:hypothetical protein
MAAGAYFSYKNYVDYSTLSAFNSQTYVAALPLTNLQDHRLSKRARTSGSLSNTFGVGIDMTAIPTAFGLAVPVKVVALCGLNFANADPLPTQNTISFNINFSNVSIGATDVGTITTGTVIDNSPSGMPANLFVVVNGNTGFTCKYISITASWSNTSTFYEAGRLWIGDAIVLPLAVEEGWTQTIKDLSIIQRSRGGQIYSDIRQRYRSTRIEVRNVQRPQVFAASAGASAQLPTFQEMFLNMGVSTEGLIIPRSQLNTSFASDNYAFMNHTGIYGVFATQPTIINTSGDSYNISMEFDESL